MPKAYIIKDHWKFVGFMNANEQKKNKLIYMVRTEFGIKTENDSTASLENATEPINSMEFFLTRDTDRKRKTTHKYNKWRRLQSWRTWVYIGKLKTHCVAAARYCWLLVTAIGGGVSMGGHWPIMNERSIRSQNYGVYEIKSTKWE